MVVGLEGFKVITAREMARIEKLSIQQGASDEGYMLQAGAGIAERVTAFIQERGLQKRVTLLVGKGNNGGDAFVVGTILLKKGYAVHAYHLFPTEESSPLCQKHTQAFTAAGGLVIFPKKASEIACKGVIIDGLLGTGFQGQLEGILLDTVMHVNQSKQPVLAIDIPSGVNGDTGEVHPKAIRATETIFLGLPKMGFFLGEGYNYIGELSSVDFGLEIRYIHQAAGMAHLLNEKSLPPLLPELTRTRHKYQAGYILAVSGSPGMPGAAMLTCLAALRAGAGIIRLFHPLGMENELLHAPYEIIRTPYKDDPAALLLEMSRAATMLIGPGLGRSSEIGAYLKSFIDKVTVPTVLDADGLFHLKGMFAKFSFPCVLTPHHREMLQLLGKNTFDDMFDECQKFAHENEVTLVLKGAPTFIFHKDKPPLIIARGDPGMATAGTGDVLTGMIAALLAQKLPPREAATLGVYMHARAGECVAEKNTSYDLIASDLLAALPQVFRELSS